MYKMLLFCFLVIANSCAEKQSGKKDSTFFDTIAFSLEIDANLLAGRKNFWNSWEAIFGKRDIIYRFEHVEICADSIVFAYSSNACPEDSIMEITFYAQKVNKPPRKRSGIRKQIPEHSVVEWNEP